MGANYSVIVCDVGNHSTATELIGDFIRSQGFALNLVMALENSYDGDEHAICVSPVVDGRALVIHGELLGIPDPLFFESHPLANHFSRSGTAIHVWSMNSGYVAGYSLFESGALTERATFFSRLATQQEEIIPGVPVPARLPGARLSDFIEQHFGDGEFLEPSVGTIIAKLGFPVHLIDFYDAVDEQEGIRILEDGYELTALCGWTVFQFRKSES